MFATPSLDEQNFLLGLLDQYLFSPVTGSYLTQSNISKRIEHTEQALRDATKDNIDDLFWLLTAEYQKPDSYTLNYAAQLLVLKLLNERDSTGSYLVWIAKQTKAQWYVKRQALHYLSERGLKEQLASLVHDYLTYNPNQPKLSSEVFEAYLLIVAEHTIQAALPYLKNKNIYKLIKSISDYGALNQLVTTTRTALGDLDTLTETIKLSYDDWYNRSQPAKNALKCVINQIGEQAVLKPLVGQSIKGSILESYQQLSLTHQEGLVRRWALEKLLKASDVKADNSTLTPYLISLLSDSNWYVVIAAATALINQGKVIVPQLLQAIHAPNMHVEAQYALLYVLASLEEDISKLVQQIPCAFIPLPEFIDQTLRDILVKYWVPEAQPRTDIRWLMEYAFKHPKSDRIPEQAKVEVRVERKVYASGVSVIQSQTLDNTLAEASIRPAYNGEQIAQELAELLRQSGLVVVDVLDYAYERQSGYSTSWLIKLGVDTVLDVTAEYKDDDPDLIRAEASEVDHLQVSTVAPYSYYSRIRTETYTYSPETDDDRMWSSRGLLDEIGNTPNYRLYQKLVAQLGLKWLTPEQGDYVIPALNIYFFGAREPLRLRDLLFYWQD